MRSRFIQELFEINQSGFAYNLAQMLISDVIGVVYRITDHIDADHPTTAPAATAQLTALGVTCKMLQLSLEQH